ncbi:MAG: amidophosphoribosyltransferase [Candidatus Tectimicrobiota bacterium]|nr:MAG: amidophosphoribosyltransferase [Candidatus Tectomicrobia bacterium]
MRALLDFLLPPRCRLCGRSTRRQPLPWVCQGCWLAIEYATPPWCAQCGQPLAAPAEAIASPGHRCGACLLTPPPFERARAVGLYRGTLREILHLAKYQGVYGLLAPLAELLQAQFAFHWGDIALDALVPVPLHRQRLRQREFDQALVLARGLARACGIPLWADVLVRQRATVSQVGLNPAQRRQNVRGAFALRHAERCAGAALLLIDDVYTTGATAGECARLLRRAGARWIGVYTVARVA